MKFRGLGIWREVLGRNVYITSQYFFPAIIYRDIISHITSTYRYIMYFFKTFKKSTVPYKVHNMGLRYIKSPFHMVNLRISEGVVCQGHRQFPLGSVFQGNWHRHRVYTVPGFLSSCLNWIGSPPLKHEGVFHPSTPLPIHPSTPFILPPTWPPRFSPSDSPPHPELIRNQQQPERCIKGQSSTY